jgi:hypothetical protein
MSAANAKWDHAIVRCWSCFGPMAVEPPVDAATYSRERMCDRCRNEPNRVRYAIETPTPRVETNA